MTVIQVEAVHQTPMAISMGWGHTSVVLKFRTVKERDNFLTALREDTVTIRCQSV